MESPGQVVGDPLTATDQPATRLSGAIVFHARLRAAKVPLAGGRRGDAARSCAEPCGGPGR